MEFLIKVLVGSAILYYIVVNWKRYENKGEVIMLDNNFQIGLQNYNGLKTVHNIFWYLRTLLTGAYIFGGVLCFFIGLSEGSSGEAVILGLILLLLAFLNWLYFAFMQEIILLFVQMAKSLNTIEVGISKDKK